MTRVVLLHGFAGTADAFGEVTAALGGAFACEAPAILGHGARSEAVTFDAEVDRLAAALDPEGAPLLVGYSMGGRLAMGLVIRHPARWRGAIFVGAHPGLRDPQERADRRHADARWIAQLRTGDLARFLDAWEAQPLFASQARLDPERRARQRAQRARLDPHALAGALEILGTGAMPSWEDALAASTLPMVFLAGALDPAYVAVGARLAQRVPLLDPVVVPGVGHNVVLEAPHAVAAAIRMLAARSGA